MRRATKAAAAALIVAAALSSCGIDVVSILDPPTSLGVGIPGFTASDDPGPGYLGVGAAYRIYDTSDQASADVARLRQRQDAAGAIPGDAIQSYLLSPGGLRYKPLVIKDDPASPTFTKSLIALHDVTLAWHQPSTQLVATIDSTEYVLERTSSKSFTTVPAVGDEDYAQTSEASGGDYVLQVIVYSFGADLVNASLRDLYSVGVALDPLDLSYN